MSSGHTLDTTKRDSHASSPQRNFKTTASASAPSQVHPSLTSQDSLTTHHLAPATVLDDSEEAQTERRSYGHVSTISADNCKHSLSCKDDFVVPSTDEEVIEITIKGEPPLFSVPSDDETDAAVRQYLFDILTKAGWGIAIHYQSAIRATLDSWGGTGSELRTRFLAYQLKDICPATTISNLEGASVSVDIAQEVRNIIATCVVHEMQRYFDQQRNGSKRTKIPSCNKNSGGSLSTFLISQSVNDSMSSHQDGPNSHTKILKPRSVSRSLLPMEWLQHSRRTADKDVQYPSSQVPLNDSCRALDNASRHGEDTKLNKQRPLTEFHPDMSANFPIRTDILPTPRTSINGKGSLRSFLTYSKDVPPSSPSPDNDLKSIRFEETTPGKSPTTEMANIPLRHRPTVLAHNGSYISSLSRPRSVFDNLGFPKAADIIIRRSSMQISLGGSEDADVRFVAPATPACEARHEIKRKHSSSSSVGERIRGNPSHSFPSNTQTDKGLSREISHPPHDNDIPTAIPKRKGMIEELEIWEAQKASTALEHSASSSSQTISISSSTEQKKANVSAVILEDGVVDIQTSLARPSLPLTNEPDTANTSLSGLSLERLGPHPNSVKDTESSNSDNLDEQAANAQPQKLSRVKRLGKILHEIKIRAKQKFG